MCDTLSLHIFTPLGCFSRRIVFSENRIGQVTLDLFYMGFAYYFKDNQQEFCRLNKLFYLWSLGPWMNYVWWFTFRFGIFIVSWCESLIWWRVIFLLIPCLYSCFIHNPSFASQIFPLKLIYPQIAFYTRYFGLTFFVDVVSTLCKETCMFTIKEHHINTQPRVSLLSQGPVTVGVLWEIYVTLDCVWVQAIVPQSQGNMSIYSCTP